MKRSIRSILVEACSAPWSGIGSEAYIYDFPKDLPDLQHFVIRVPHSFDLTQLSENSALTPVKRLVPGMHVGQPLLELEGHPEITILPRQSGINLGQWRLKKSLEINEEAGKFAENYFRKDMAIHASLKDFDARRGNPFVKILDEIHRLGELGYSHDISAGNIFIDEAKHQLGLIDQFRPEEADFSGRRKNQNVEQAATKLIAEFATRDWKKYRKEAPAYIEKWQQSATEITEMIEQAKDVVLSTHRSGIMKPIPFAKVDDIQAVGLNEPPHALVEKLRVIEKRAQIPNR